MEEVGDMGKEELKGMDSSYLSMFFLCYHYAANHRCRRRNESLTLQSEKFGDCSVGSGCLADPCCARFCGQMDCASDLVSLSTFVVRGVSHS